MPVKEPPKNLANKEEPQAQQLKIKLDKSNNNNNNKNNKPNSQSELLDELSSFAGKLKIALDHYQASSSTFEGEIDSLKKEKEEIEVQLQEKESELSKYKEASAAVLTKHNQLLGIGIDSLPLSVLESLYDQQMQATLKIKKAIQEVILV